MTSLEKIMAWLPKFRLCSTYYQKFDREKKILKRMKKEKVVENEEEKIKYNMPG